MTVDSPSSWLRSGIDMSHRCFAAAEAAYPQLSSPVEWRASPQLLAVAERLGIPCRQDCRRCVSAQVWELCLWAWHEDDIAGPVQTATDEHCQLMIDKMRTSAFTFNTTGRVQYVLLTGIWALFPSAVQTCHK